MYQNHVRKLIEAWNTGELDLLDSVVASNVVRISPPSTDSDVKNLKELKELITNFRAQFPDLRVTIDHENYEVSRSVLEWTFTGTNTGEGDFGKTGKKVEVSGASIARYENNKMVHEAIYYDTMLFNVQLGLVDGAQAAGA